VFIFLSTPREHISFCIYISRPGLLEQICDEKSRPRGSGPSFQPAEGVPTGSILSTTFSSWGKKFNSAIDSGKAKVRLFYQQKFDLPVIVTSD
jgi:hypothetical protein